MRETERERERKRERETPLFYLRECNDDVAYRSEVVGRCKQSLRVGTRLSEKTTAVRFEARPRRRGEEREREREREREKRSRSKAAEKLAGMIASENNWGRSG